MFYIWKKIYKEIILLQITRFHLAASFNTLHPETLEKGGRANTHSTCLCDLSPERPSNTITGECVYTHQFNFGQGSFRKTTNNNMGEREEDGGERDSKKGRIGTESVRETEGRKEEGGLGITSANHSSRETHDELQKWDLRQMPSFFQRAARMAAPPWRTQWLERGETGVCQAP